MPARYDVNGMVAVVTGAAGGIGHAVARLLRENGARVAGWDLRPAPGLDHAEQVDCTDEDAVDLALARTVEALGPIGLHVGAAGMLGPVAPAHAVPLPVWRQVLRVNLEGVLVPATAIVRHLLQQPAGGVRGRLVLIGSQQGKEGMPLGAAYSCSKAAVHTLAQSMGRELAREGILVNAVTPTAIETGMAQELTPERRADITARIPLGRFGTVDEVAQMVAFLGSRACTFQTAALFDLSGGRSQY